MQHKNPHESPNVLKLFFQLLPSSFQSLTAANAKSMAILFGTNIISQFPVSFSVKIFTADFFNDSHEIVLLRLDILI